ncbi:syndecan-4 [Colossoma macropomum]|uniref:syndecan-4 n=1 Tax=Colossoma macropomum TaxID=42526 RepID=UPI001863BDC0|nr:syndecan-4 [Colossoma macropomum]
MMKVYLTVFFLAAAVFAESVRETETWVRDEGVEPHDADLESSGDFGFNDELDLLSVEEDDEYEFSGSGDDDDEEDEYGDYNAKATDESEINNEIPDADPPRILTEPDDDLDLVRQNEIAHSSSVQQNKAEQNIFNKTEVLAAVIAGGAVGLLFAVLLILLLVYRMKKKDEGSYDLGKKPIYKKAPTTEIYA